MAPMTRSVHRFPPVSSVTNPFELLRFRADDEHTHADVAREYYEQRATEGGLIITEATCVYP